MKSLAWLVVGVIASAVTPARAESEGGGDGAVAPRYVGGAFAVHEGGGLGGYELTTVGANVFTGYRFSRWISLEGFFDGRVATSSSADHEGVGAMCVGGWSNLRTSMLGARLMVHVVHRPTFDVSIFPSAAGGITLDQAMVTGFGSAGGCAVTPMTRAGVALSGGLGVALELRATRWFGFRAMFETSIDAGDAVTGGYAVLSLGGYVGPVFRM
jgi:hypothetical protein